MYRTHVFLRCFSVDAACVCRDKNSEETAYCTCVLGTYLRSWETKKKTHACMHRKSARLRNARANETNACRMSVHSSTYIYILYMYRCKVSHLGVHRRLRLGRGVRVRRERQRQQRHGAPVTRHHDGRRARPWLRPHPHDHLRQRQVGPDGMKVCRKLKGVACPVLSLHISSHGGNVYAWGYVVCMYVCILHLALASRISSLLNIATALCDCCPCPLSVRSRRINLCAVPRVWWWGWVGLSHCFRGPRTCEKNVPCIRRKRCSERKSEVCTIYISLSLPPPPTQKCVCKFKGSTYFYLQQ